MTQTLKGNSVWWVNQKKKKSYKNRPERRLKTQKNRPERKRQRQKKKIRNKKAKWGLEIHLQVSETRTTFLALWKNQLKVSQRTQPKTWNFQREAQGMHFKLQVKAMNFWIETLNSTGESPPNWQMRSPEIKKHLDSKRNSPLPAAWDKTFARQGGNI